MNTAQAFIMGQKNKGKEEMVFDWLKAVQIIKDRNLKNCSAGLHSDLEWTCGRILEDRNPVPEEETYTYLASTWAIPVLVTDDDEEIECYIMQSETTWDAETYWPEEALNALNIE